MRLTEENSKIVDDYLKALIEHCDATGSNTLSIIDYLQQPGNNHKLFEEIYYAFLVADHIQKKLALKPFQLNVIDKNPHIDIQQGHTEAFIALGGFSSIWADEEKERVAKQKVDIVNDSVLTTNNTVRLLSFVSAGAAIASLAVAILAYNSTSDINVKSLPQPPIQVQPIRVLQKPIDTVYLLNPAPLQSQPTNSVNTSKTNK